MSEQDNSYFYLITHDVFSDKDLPANAKLLFALITALTGTKGYCFASNDYLASRMDISSRQIQVYITALENKGYVVRNNVLKPDSKEADHRELYPNCNTPVKKTSGGGEENFTPPREENFTHSSKDISNKEEYIKESKEKSPGVLPQPHIMTKEEQLERDFLVAWDLYPKKVSKPYALQCFKKHVKHEEMPAFLKGIERWMCSSQWKDAQYIPNMSTFINQRKWEDEVPVTKKDMQDSLTEDLNANDFIPFN